MSLAQPVLKVNVEGRELCYAISNEHTAWRVNTLLTKEPDTIAWINSMKPGETFMDIGANMGIYTVYAAARGLNVISFEPEADNYQLLCRSITIGEFDIMPQAYCLALSDKFEPTWLYLSGHLAGGSCHSIGENVNHRLKQRPYEIKQAALSVTLDAFGFKPDYVKIDVDGFEHKVVAGGEHTILGAKSVLLEINEALPEHAELCAFMAMHGFRTNPEQVEAAMRKEGTFKGCGNRIFYKE